MRQKRSYLLAQLIVVIGMATQIQAVTRTYFGEDQGLGENVRLAGHPNADGARSDFLSNLVGVGIETFERFQDNDRSISVSFPGAGAATLLATLEGEGHINEETNPSATNGVGRYPISGDKYWESGNEFTINFGQPVAAFGFYGVDIGDFNGQLLLTLDTGSIKMVNFIPNSRNITGGSVLYYGIIEDSPDDVFRAATFTNTQFLNDIFGFDDMTIGSLEQVVIKAEEDGDSLPAPVPEPLTPALMFMGLGALGLRARRCCVRWVV